MLIRVWMNDCVRGGAMRCVLVISMWVAPGLHGSEASVASACESCLYALVPSPDSSRFNALFVLAVFRCPALPAVLSSPFPVTPGCLLPNLSSVGQFPWFLISPFLSPILLLLFLHPS